MDGYLLDANALSCSSTETHQVFIELCVVFRIFDPARWIEEGRIGKYLRVRENEVGAFTNWGL